MKQPPMSLEAGAKEGRSGHISSEMRRYGEHQWRKQLSGSRKLALEAQRGSKTGLNTPGESPR